MRCRRECHVSFLEQYKQYYYDTSAEYWEESGWEERIIELNNRLIKITFEPNIMFDTDHRIDVYLDCIAPPINY